MKWWSSFLFHVIFATSVYGGAVADERHKQATLDALNRIASALEKMERIMLHNA